MPYDIQSKVRTRQCTNQTCLAVMEHYNKRHLSQTESHQTIIDIDRNDAKS